MKLLTHTSPFIKDSIFATVKSLRFCYFNHSEMRLVLCTTFLEREPCEDFETVLFSAPKVEFIFNVNWN